MKNRDEVRLHHMLDAARKAIAFTQDRERTDLGTDELLALAVVRAAAADVQRIPLEEDFHPFSNLSYQAISAERDSEGTAPEESKIPA